MVWLSGNVGQAGGQTHLDVDSEVLEHRYLWTCGVGSLFYPVMQVAIRAKVNMGSRVSVRLTELSCVVRVPCIPGTMGGAFIPGSKQQLAPKFWRKKRLAVPAVLLSGVVLVFGRITLGVPLHFKLLQLDAEKVE